MCLQHMLAACFQPRDAAQRREFDRLWHASNIAAELCQQLATRLRLPDAANLTTLLVLSFLGRCRRRPAARRRAAGAPERLRACRARAEGTGPTAAHELGHLLMRAWDLPFDLLQDARTVGSLRFDPDLRLAPEREAGLTLCTLCAMLANASPGATWRIHCSTPCMTRARHAGPAAPAGAAGAGWSFGGAALGAAAAPAGPPDRPCSSDNDVALSLRRLGDPGKRARAAELLLKTR